MAGRERKGRRKSGSGPSGEIHLKARAVSRGIAVGTVVWLHGDSRQFFKVKLRPSEVPREVERLRSAVESSRRQLKRLAGELKKAGPSGKEIFEVHLAFLDDPALPSKFEGVIRSDRVNAEWAITQVSEEQIAKIRALSDEHLSDRYIDIKDVSERVLNALSDPKVRDKPLARESVIVAHDIRPSTLIELANSSPKALITANGGWTSHTFIIARDLRIPAVTGLRKQIRELEPGRRVLVDGFSGTVILDPSGNGARRPADGAAESSPTPERAPALRSGFVATLDGLKIKIYVNSDSAEAYRRSSEMETAGVGLFRSEFIVDPGRRVPGEASQLRAYTSIAEAAGGGGVKIRTFDIGPDRGMFPESLREHNPALGLRAIRFSLKNRKSLRTQLRAILRAAHRRSVDIVLPMVTGVEEIREVAGILREESRKLKAEGKTLGKPRLGAMIELPSAVFIADQLIAETDFVCLGTNDLIQYILAADRDNEFVSQWYRSLHPAVLRAIRAVITSASGQGKQVVVCGEMAGSPFYVPILIGLGCTDLSMNVSSIPGVSRVVAGVAREECTALAASLLNASTADEAEAIATTHVKRSWKHLFPRDFSFSAA